MLSFGTARTAPEMQLQRESLKVYPPCRDDRARLEGAGCVPRLSIRCSRLPAPWPVSGQRTRSSSTGCSTSREGARVLDVLFHLPQATVDRRARPKIRDAIPGTIVTIEAKVTEHRGPPNARSRAPFKVLVEDETGDVELVFFLANHEWVRSRLPVGATRWISGKLELWDGRRQMVHPDRVMNAEELDRLPSVEPVYGLTEGLYQRGVARAAEGALKRLPPMPEWISTKTLSDLKLPSFGQALGAMHRPATPEDVDPASPAATRLAYDELFANQLALLLMRARMRAIPGRAHKAEGALARRLEAALPFSLTRAQRGRSTTSAPISEPKSAC